MGSRYGSLKQMDGVGPNGEAIIDYSIYDAVRAGFGKVVFIIRHSFEKAFREIFTPEHFGGKVEIEFVFQELEYLPEGFSVPEGREKPWGTCHAVMMAAPAVSTPFAVINSDDFYGREGYAVLADYLRSVDGQTGKYSMVGYNLHNTLSDYGTVSRGECSVDADGNLVSIIERTAIQRMEDGRIMYKDSDGLHPLDENTVVSMNLFGFTGQHGQPQGRVLHPSVRQPAHQRGQGQPQSTQQQCPVVRRNLQGGPPLCRKLHPPADRHGHLP